MSPSCIRIIPRLDIKGPNVVKGVHLEGLRVVGRPEIFAPKYYLDGADEIIYIDSVASLYGRNHLVEIVKRAADEIFVPLTVGGGIRSCHDVQMLLRAGADKVAINTAAIHNPSLIKEGALTFGSQCIVVSIQARRRSSGNYECLTDNGRETTGLDVLDWAKQAEALGAGEILLTSVDRDGTGRGYDLELVRSVSEAVGVPTIAAGGAGSVEHIKDAAVNTNIGAVCASSIFHYALIEFTRNASYEEEGNTEFLYKQTLTPQLLRKNIRPITIKQLKDYLAKSGIPCRVDKTFIGTPS